MLALTLADWPARAASSARPWRAPEATWLDARYSGAAVGAGRSGMAPGRSAAAARRARVAAKVLGKLALVSEDKGGSSARLPPPSSSPYLRHLLGDALTFSEYLGSLEHRRHGSAEFKFTRAGKRVETRSLSRFVRAAGGSSGLETRSVKDAFGPAWFWAQHLHHLSGSSGGSQ